MKGTVVVEAVGMWATGVVSRCPHTHSPTTAYLGFGIGGSLGPISDFWIT
jgi:hypothetical protein